MRIACACVWILSFLGFCLVPATTEAISGDFTIGILLGDDNTPPTIPQNVVATAVSTSQINISWDDSSDSVGVTGYQIFRDSIQIATSTLTSFADTGLASSTLFSYTITAFDAAGNISAQSATATATTFDPEAVDPPVVEENNNNGTFIGSRSQATTALNETPDSIDNKVGPLNVRTFDASRINGGIQLRWLLPSDTDDVYVRVVSNDVFYPRDDVDGFIVYEGTGTSVIDTRGNTNAERYYSIFTYDGAGNRSSGVVTFVPMSVNEQLEFVPEVEVIVPPIPTINIQLQWNQRGDDQTVATGLVVIEQSDVTVVSLPYKLVPEHLKTIIVRLTHPQDQTQVFSFMLRANADKSAYEAAIGSLPKLGDYQMSVEVFDFKTRTQTIATSTVRVIDTVPVTTKYDGLAVVRNVTAGILFVLLLIAIGRRLCN